ncbi:RICIN domain-containing protein [Streptomyces sp. NBRC 14336]|uniref:RICIN domain-containing protein n=1 Tax=Streptomyces sp. NBRC 14336 TaxID=3030992 RepID=UPI002553400B|nr:RICIN domain-containing protein [Streptomyces sp. NBRC 14336]
MTPTDSDRDLVARLGPPGTGTESVPLLMARHWRAAHEYAVICLATAGSAAQMVTAAAFHRVLGNPSGEALRPQLLTAVRDAVREWAADDKVSAVLPELRKTTGARGMRAARSMTPERRRLAERAFGSLPAASQCLLWHTEVEAEPISIPAGLLGVDPGTAHAALDQAREQFRAACVRAHRELAPTRECGFHNRLLDVPIRRGGTLLPDVERHLAGCRYCRHAAEQLSHFEGGLGELLAETVLGWGARRYLDSRPGRAGDHPERLLPARGGRHRPARQRPTVLPQGPSRVVVGVGLTALALLATVLVSRGWSDDNGVPDPHATWGAPSAVTGRTATDPASAATGRAPELAHGPLRNLGTGLCLDLQSGAPRPGAATVLAGCSAAGSQQWSYRKDGQLRSGADPGLCLDSHASHADEGTVVLADCLLHPGASRYDLTVHGELLLRDDGDRAVAPGRDGKPTVAERDGSDSQRWQLGDGGTDREPARTPEPEERQDPYETRMARTDTEPRSEPAAPPGPVTRVLEAATTVTASLAPLLS